MDTTVKASGLPLPLRWAILVASVLLGLVFLALFWVADQAGRRAVAFVNEPPSFQLVESLARLGLKGQRRHIPNTQLPAWYLEGPKNRAPVLLVPGWGDDATHLLAPYGSWLAQERQVWVLDLPGQPGGPPGRVGMGPVEALAVGQAMVALNQHHGGRISLMGLSMGGSAAIAAAARHPDVLHALVTDGAFLSPASGMQAGLQDIMATMHLSFLAAWGAQRAESRLAQSHGTDWPVAGRAQDLAPQLKGKPWLLIHGEKDHVVSPQDAKRLSKLGGAMLWGITQADHVSEPWASPLAIRQGRYRKVVQQALNGALPQ